MGDTSELGGHEWQLQNLLPEALGSQTLGSQNLASPVGALPAPTRMLEKRGSQTLGSQTPDSSLVRESGASFKIGCARL